MKKPKIELELKIYTKIFSLVTKKGLQFIDITNKVKKIVSQSQVKNGWALVYSKHTTAAIKINENEPCLLDDLKNFLQQLAPLKKYYKHNDLKIRKKNLCADECLNAHSHCQQILLGTSETIPLIKGKLVLGKWQRIFLIELDRSRKREVVIQVLGS